MKVTIQGEAGTNIKTKTVKIDQYYPATASVDDQHFTPSMLRDLADKIEAIHKPVELKCTKSMVYTITSDDDCLVFKAPCGEMVGFNKRYQKTIADMIKEISDE